MPVGVASASQTLRGDEGGRLSFCQDTKRRAASLDGEVKVSDIENCNLGETFACIQLY